MKASPGVARALFTIGRGNYTEQDVKEAARVLHRLVERPGGRLFPSRFPRLWK